MEKQHIMIQKTEYFTVEYYNVETYKKTYKTKSLKQAEQFAEEHKDDYKSVTLEKVEVTTIREKIKNYS